MYPQRLWEVDAEDEDRKDCYLGVRLSVPWLDPPPCYQALGTDLETG